MVTKRLGTEHWQLATGFRLLLVGICTTGIILNFSLAGWGSGALELLSYYTIQSNILVWLFFVGLIAYTWRHKGQTPVAPSYHTVKGAVMVCVTLTFLVYHFVLSPTMFSMEARSYAISPANLLVHYVVPLMAIADWLLFDKKGSFKKLDPLKWAAIPLVYLAFALVRAQFASFSISGSRYPYFFIDIDRYGVGPVVLNALGVTIGYLALGYLVYLIDLAWAKLATRWAKPEC
jgi:hypothetical protein